MSRKKQQPVLVPPDGIQTVKAEFLECARILTPAGFNILGTDVKAGKMSVRQWADYFGLAGTWIERWAEDTVRTWELHPKTFPYYPAPRDEATDAGYFYYAVSGIRPFSRLSLGLTMGGSLRGGSEENDWRSFVTAMHTDLDEALEEYKQAALKSGAIRFALIPNDLGLKLTVAAHYLFGKKSAAEIAALPTVRRDRTVVTRWLDQILTILNLPARPPGRTRKTR